MTTKIVRDQITPDELRELAHDMYGDIIKAVVDVEQEIMGVGGELHVDIQSILIEQAGSKGDKTWGINFYLDKTGDDFVEFDSMINLKPALGNKSRWVEDALIQNKIKEIVNKIVK
jgi:hypothetical protein